MLHMLQQEIATFVPQLNTDRGSNSMKLKHSLFVLLRCITHGEASLQLRTQVPRSAQHVRRHALHRYNLQSQRQRCCNKQ